MSIRTLLIYTTIGLLIFTLAINFVDSLGVFPISLSTGMQITNSSNAIAVVTGNTDYTINNLWAIGTTLGASLAIGTAILMKSATPIALYIFATVFWTSYLRALSIITFGGYIPSQFITMFTVGVVFLFVGAFISILAGGD